MKPGWLLLLLTASLPAPAAIIIAGSSPVTNDRFANNPAFIGAAYDWSGVGRSASGAWATMIAPDIFLSATHYHPAIGSTLSFLPGNNPADAPVTATVAAGQQIGGTDLWIGRLGSALPSSIQTYGRLTIPVTSGDFASSGLPGALALLSGVSGSPSYGASPTLAHAVGSNAIEGFIPGVATGGSTGDTLVTVRNLPGDGVFGFATTTYESQLSVGDSGSPLMVVSGGELVLAGIAWAIGMADIDPGAAVAVRDISYFSYLGNYAPAISGYIALNSVPEPSVLALVAFALPLIRRRNPTPSAVPRRRPR